MTEVEQDKRNPGGTQKGQKGDRGGTGQKGNQWNSLKENLVHRNCLIKSKK